MKHIGRIFDKVSGHLFKRNKHTKEDHPDTESLSDEALNESVADNKEPEEDTKNNRFEGKAKIQEMKNMQGSWGEDDDGLDPRVKKISFFEEEQERLRLEREEEERLRQGLTDLQKPKYLLFLEAIQADKELDEICRKDREMRFLRDAREERRKERFDEALGKIKAQEECEKENEKHNPGHGFER